jgi:hypothetical protein
MQFSVSHILSLPFDTAMGSHLCTVFQVRRLVAAYDVREGYNLGRGVATASIYLLKLLSEKVGI